MDQSDAALDRQPVVNDLSAWLLSGRVTAAEVPHGLEQAVEAERLGFSRLYLSERYNLKEAGALLGGIGARTTRIGLGTGVIAVRSRHPLLAAALGATLHAAYGPRFVLGIGRSVPGWLPGTGDRAASYTELIDYADIVKRLWRGETVNYRGPVGAFEDLALGDTFLGPPPKIWIGILGGPQGARAAASRAVDGVMLWDMMTPEATRLAIGRIRRECERVGRDPATLRICQPVVTAPEASAEETRALTHARMVTYLGWEQGAAIVRMNGWDPQVVTRVRAHPQFSGMAPSSADLRFHREDLVDPAALIPDSWIEQSCAIGSVQACVKMLQEFRDAGADEVATYGSSPVENAGVIDAWRRRRSAPAGAGSRVG